MSHEYGKMEVRAIGSATRHIADTGSAEGRRNGRLEWVLTKYEQLEGGKVVVGVRVLWPCKYHLLGVHLISYVFTPRPTTLLDEEELCWGWCEWVCWVRRR